MIRLPIAALAALVLATPALAAANLSPAEVVQRHIDAGGNVDAIVADYADNAVVMQQGRILEGKDAIRAFYTQMMGGGRKPAADDGKAAPAGPPPMKVTKVWEQGDVGFVTWEMGPVHATEEFLVRDGKIQVQAVFMSGMPGGPPHK